MSVRRVAFIAALVICGLSLGCSSIARSEYALARKFEGRGRPREAATLYALALRQIPKADSHWRSETYYRLGECLWSTGEQTEAFSSFQHAVDADDANLIARLRLGEIYLAGGALDRASEQAAAVLQDGHMNSEALALLGAASAAAGQDQLAEIAFKKVLESEPGRVNIAISLADIYNRQDRENDARGVLREAATARPGSSLPLLALGRLEEQEGNAVAAERAYRDAVRREDTPDVNLRLAQFLERSSRVTEAEKVLRRVDGMRPAMPTALPDFELLAGRVPNALEQYLTALHSGVLQRRGMPSTTSPRAAVAARVIEAELQSANGSEDPRSATSVALLHLDEFRSELDAATIAILQSEIAMAAHDVSTAELHARTAVMLAPKSAGSHYVLGVAQYQAGERSAARSSWLEAIQQDSSFVPARLALAREALATGDTAGAEQYVLPAVRDEPGNVRALTIYARVLIAEDRLGAAVTVAQRAAAVDPNDAEPHVLLGEVAQRQKNYPESLVQFERAVVHEPRSLEALNGLVRVYREGVITPRMLANMEVMAWSQPQSATLMEIAGRLYAEHGWYADAERCLRRSLMIDPHRGTAAAVLAQVFASRGDMKSARESAEKVGGRTAALVSGLAAQQRNDTKTAIAQYEAAVREGEHSGIAANNLAWLYAEQGTQLDRALSLAQQARAQAPKDPAVLDTVGVVHLRRREFTQAIDVLKNAAMLTATSGHAAQPEVVAEIHRHLSEAYLRAGLPDAAAAAANHARERLRERLIAPAIVVKPGVE